MPLSKEDAERLKAKILEKVDSLPEENRELIREYIKNLNEEGLEEFLKTGEIKIPAKPSPPQNIPLETQCIFCSIVKNQIPSYKIDENKQAVAVLEINPLSEGHSLIFPLTHSTIEEIPKSAFSLAHKIAKKIKKKLKPEEVKIETSTFQGHAIINIIPLYKDKKIEKRKADESELLDLQKKLMKIKRQKQTKKSKKQKDLPEVCFRIP